ncbi:DsbA family protein [Halohasta litorea]|uniref:DsbA family protein n=1 Tax=Halohasta litorea TaxID=869891 RepID=A0ABD6D667_9EURY|nr:DsbA family protein [Halohasta litorea]
MFIFMGSYSGGNNQTVSTDSEDQESTEDHSQAGIDDYTGDDGGDSEQDSSADEAAAGVAGAAVSAAGASAASGAAGAAGAAGAGAGAGAEPPECDNDEDTSESENQDSETEETKQPESPEIEDPKREDDIGDPETETELEDHEEKDTDHNEDADNDEENQETDEDDEDEDDEEDEDETLVVVQRVDPLSAMSWAVQPVMKRVEECYDDDVELIYKPAPVREFDPAEEKQHWKNVSQELEMPVDPSFWDGTPPESTALLTKAFEAANRQQRGIEFIRALWRRAIAAGHDIANKEILIDLATDLSLNRQQFIADLDAITLDSSEDIDLPKTHLQIHDLPVSWTGRIRYTDFNEQFTFQGIDEQEPQDLEGFVSEHGPVATPEVMEIYGVHREKAVESLQNLAGVSSFEIGGERFWDL